MNTEFKMEFFDEYGSSPIQQTLDLISHPLCLTESTKNKIITAISLEAFKEIKETRLGLCHTIEKHTVGTMTFLGTAALPIAAITGGFYYASGQLGWYKTLGLLVGATAVNAGAGKLLGINPRKMLMVLGGVALAYLAKSTAEAAMHSYNVKEREVFRKHERLHEEILSQEGQVYNTVAKELQEQYIEALDSPQRMYELKSKAKTIKENLQSMKDLFIKRLGLGSTEFSLVMNKLNQVLDLINKFKLEIKDSKSVNDDIYNTELLLTLPISAFEKLGLPRNAKLHMDEGAKAKMGRVSKCINGLYSSFVATAAAVSAPAIGALGSYFFHKPTYEATMGKMISYCQNGSIDSDWHLLALSVAVTAPALLYISSKVGKQIWNRGEQEMKDYNTHIDANIVKANSELTKTFDGIADQLRLNYLSDEDKLSLQSKLRLIEAQIERYKVFETTTVIRNLEEAVQLS